MTLQKKIIFIISVLIIIGGAVVYVLQMQAKNTTGTITASKAEIAGILEPMLRDMTESEWDKEAFARYSSSSLKQWFSVRKTNEGMPLYKRLGRMIMFDGVTSLKIEGQELTVLSSAEFENSKVFIGIKMSRENGEWLLDSIEMFPAKQIFK